MFQRTMQRLAVVALLALVTTVVAAAPAKPVAAEGGEPESAETVRVIVELETTPADPDGSGAARSIDAGLDGLTVVAEFETSDYAVVELESDQLDELAARPEVQSVSPDPVAHRALDESVPLVNAPARWDEGHRGGGVTIAVIDDGVDPTHPNFADPTPASKIVAEACFTQSSCFGTSQATGPGSGAPCSGCTHGTHVAGIAAGEGGNRDGVAPDATLFSIRVFPSVNQGARFSDIARGLEHVLSRVDDFDIAAVNLSLEGEDLFGGTCNNAFPAVTAAVQALRDRGVAVVAASGNRSAASAMTAPACISGVTSVGSHTKSTPLSIANSSNASPITSLVAPGVGIISPDPGVSPYSGFSGTSAAAPHVSGAFAIWRDRFPGINSQEAQFLSTAHGRTILDTRNGRRYPRLFMDDPANVLLASLFAPTALSVNASYIPLVGDFDGNITDDVFWYAPGSAPDFVWSSTDESGFTSRGEPVFGTYRVAVFDQNGDGRDDILFHGPGSGIDSLWFGRADGTFNKTNISLPGDHRLFVGEFTGDNRDDVLLYTPGPGADRLLRGGSNVTFSSLTINGTYVPLIGDFDGDGVDDIFWYAPGTAPDFIWYGPFPFSSVARNVNGSYLPLVGDFNRDSVDDIFWYAPGSAPDFIWRGTKSQSFTSSPTTVNGSYRPVVFDADGNLGDEILWYPTSGSTAFLWRFSGNTPVSVGLTVPGAATVLTGGFDMLGGTDIFFYRPGSLGDPLWYSIGDS